MEKAELEYNNRKKKIDDFKAELNQLSNKYKFGIKNSDNYNNMDEYCGTDYYFIVDGETWYNETIDEIIANNFKKHLQI